jgi:hypothetical protein
VLTRRDWGVFGYRTVTSWRDERDAPFQQEAKWFPTSLALTAMANAGLFGIAGWLRWRSRTVG